MECKKAQPKEVMLPANLAKTRAAGRGAYGEFLMLNPGPVTATSNASSVSALRYAPYPLPLNTTPTIPLTAIAVGPAPLHYSIYDVAGCKRVFAPVRPLAATRATPTLAYSVSDLVGLQGLEIPTTVYTNMPPGLGL